MSDTAIWQQDRFQSYNHAVRWLLTSVLDEFDIRMPIQVRQCLVLGIHAQHDYFLIQSNP